MLEWARERSGMTVGSLLEKFPKYLEWESGDLGPTLKQLEAFARKTATPLGFLFLQNPPVESLPVPDFRTVGDQGVRRPSPDLLETIQIMQRRQAWMRDYLIECGAETLPFIGSMTIDDSVSKVANNIRATLGITSEWAEKQKTWEDALNAFKQSVSDVGILVFGNGVVGANTRRVLKTEEFRGFVLCDDLAPLIFLNNADAKSARMFTLAHELAHLWMGQGGVFDLPALEASDDKVERFCNAVAAEFLVPKDVLSEVWAVVKAKSDAIQRLARQFKVSAVVAARRLLDLKKITKPQFFALYKDAMERSKSGKGAGGGDYYLTQRSRLDAGFTSAVYRSVRSGSLAHTEAYRLTGMKGKTFDQYFNPVEGSKKR